MAKFNWSNFQPNLRRFFSRPIVFILGFFIFAVVLTQVFFLAPPGDFSRGAVVTVPEGLSIAEIAVLFSEKHLVRSPLVFEYLVRFVRPHGQAGMAVAGDYVFPRPENAVAIARRLARAEYGIAPVKATIPEGATTYDIAVLLARLIPNFDPAAFIEEAQPREGYLFPDTYYLQPTWPSARIMGLMEKQFQKAFEPLLPLVADSGRTLEQIVIMASLLEREAHTTEARRTIAGILWKRLDTGMPLQVDAAFAYIIDKNTFELSLKDLATSSPYNTYRYRGLPIGPIANPGLDALTAALTPLESDYWFYLSDRFGNLHYAVDFEGHKRNKTKYLP